MKADTPKRTTPRLEVEMLVHDMGKQPVTAISLSTFNALGSVAVFHDFIQTLVAGISPFCLSYLQ